MSRTRTRLLAAGFVLSSLLAVICCREAILQFRKYEALKVREMTLAIEAADNRELIDSLRLDRAKRDMRVIERSYKQFYAEHGEWPKDIGQVAERLAYDQAKPTDPWGQPYTVRIEDVPQPDGQSIQRPFVYCQPPGDRPRIQWPER